jgi:hypothetical protein
MPDLFASFHFHDLGHLRIIAELWGLELESRDRDSAAEELAASLLDPELARETLDVLPANARPALDALLAARGRIPWAEFARRFGEIREMGEGKRDREQPHRKPVSAAEALFYRGLIAKAFFDTEKGAQEFAYIPDDLLKIINREERKENAGEVLGRPATPVEKAFEIPANDHILDDATTLLAALRICATTARATARRQTPQEEHPPGRSGEEVSRSPTLRSPIHARGGVETFDHLRRVAAHPVHPVRRRVEE